MAWDGDGTYRRRIQSAAQGGTGLWQRMRDAVTRKIRADHHDENDDDMADGINNCITKDGQNTPTRDLPMANRKHTGVGAASERTHYATYGQLRDLATFVPDTQVAGTGDAIVLTPDPAAPAYAAGQAFRFFARANNTGAVTVNVNEHGAVAVKLADGSNPVAGSFAAGQPIEIMHDGTEFRANVYPEPDTPDPLNADVGRLAADASITSGSWQTVATVMLTPGDATKKVRLQASLFTNFTAGSLYWAIFRGATPLTPHANPPTAAIPHIDHADDDSVAEPHQVEAFDSPASDAEQTYTLQVYASTGTATVQVGSFIYAEEV